MRERLFKVRTLFIGLGLVLVCFCSYWMGYKEGVDSEQSAKALADLGLMSANAKLQNCNRIITGVIR